MRECAIIIRIRSLGKDFIFPICYTARGGLGGRHAPSDLQPAGGDLLRVERIARAAGDDLLRDERIARATGQ